MPIDKTYTESEFRGQIHLPAPVTPFTPEGDLMLDAFAEVLRYYLDAVGVDSFVIAGNNGEGSALGAEELGLLTRTAVDVVKSRVPFFVHVSRTSNLESVARARIAAEAGAPGICLTGQPFIHAATKAEIVGRFEMMAKAVPVPLYAFNDVGHQRFNITPEILRAICDVAPVVVVSDGTGDFLEATRMIVEMGDRFPILYGSATMLVPGLLLNSGGLGGTGPELFGTRCRELLEVHDMTPARRVDLHDRYGRVNTAMMKTAAPPAAMKASLNMIGVPAGVPREPVQPLTPDDEARVREVLTECGVFDRPATEAR